MFKSRQAFRTLIRSWVLAAESASEDRICGGMDALTPDDLDAIIGAVAQALKEV